MRQQCRQLPGRAKEQEQQTENVKHRRVDKGSGGPLGSSSKDKRTSILERRRSTRQQQRQVNQQARTRTSAPATAPLAGPRSPRGTCAPARRARPGPLQV